MSEQRKPRGAAHRIERAVRDLIGIPLPVGLTAWDGSTAGPEGSPRVVLRNRRALRHVLYRPGELGLARAYVSGDLDVRGDLTDGLRRCWSAIRAGGTGAVRFGPAQWRRLLTEAVALGVIGPRPAPPPGGAPLAGRLHSRSRDRDVIAHHYDTGNEFYELLLDPNMAYSSGYWTRTGEDYGLAEAQHDKLDLICRKLRLAEGDRLLDVGCGWGSLILHAARHHGVHATGVTLSAQQAAHIQGRIDELGLRGQVDVRLQDYREISGEPFDAVASVEMGEHVGENQYPVYAATLHRMLRPGGNLLVQQMSRAGDAPGGGAFIEAYIAADMSMVPVGHTLDHLERTGLEIRDVQAMREHYTRTVEEWARTLDRNWERAVALLGPERARTWRLYLAGGGLAFEENRMGVNQILATKTTADGRGAAAALAGAAR
ncbi:cyclopropane-fatty-acyl-phospholipid synthase family protein [Saccharopolyspora sp. 7B]|uniref:SAM-dependent methyltransferase n=1 Tax=Saccharopolyspora sp. 7B TaxID=2877240 RepID=UPI001CD40C71|nr:cyclopropane-fatty-acyl-phospholipid synthase family protein [Saccharopolyspora sp. 7B]MCA1283452.1 cyclopropane-fatty-acyl-phospholipid synthase family protein [Saccharopolyspora sp. 7B]